MIVLYSIVAVTTVGAVALLVATTAKPRPGCRDLVQQRDEFARHPFAASSPTRMTA